MWPAPADDRRHRANGHRWWAERWCFEVVDRSGLAAFVEYTLLPQQRMGWFVAAVSRPGEDMVLCRDPEVPFPSNEVLEIRSGALWSHAICEEPLSRWTVAMEAFALGMEDPYQAWTNEVGDRIGIACDLEWEGTSRAETSVEPDHYAVWAVVHGDLQVGDDRWDVDGVGRWSHRWGEMVPSWFNQMTCSQLAADNVTVCWLIDGPSGPVRAIRHVLPQGWCVGTE